MNTGTKYFFNRAPLLETPFTELPLGAIKPEGWLRNQLSIQAAGLTGHLDEFWDSVGSYSGWLGGTGENWERGPYYCDGLLPLAYLLDDEALIAKTRPWIEWTIGSQRPDGWFGPAANEDWWPRMVMLKVLVQYQEVTADSRVIPFMSRYFRYMKDRIDEVPLRDWGRARGGEYLYSLYWLYNRTGEAFLLELAETIFRQTLDWTGIFTEFPFVKPTDFYYNWQKIARHNWDEINNLMQYHATHVVNVVMGIKEPGLYYQQSRDPRHREAVFKGIAALARYHGQVAGNVAGDEHLSGTNPSRGSELCSVVEYMFSLETQLKMASNSRLGDLLEKIAYNALPAAFGKDMWSHQYDQQPNQVLVTKAKRDWFNNNEEANLFGLEPHFGCCTANMHQGWPKLVEHFWLATADRGLAAMVYGPCRVEAEVGSGVTVRIDEITNYPFNGRIEFRLHCPVKIKFPLMLRIPAWCQGAEVKINGAVFNRPDAGGFRIIDREWQDQDQISLELTFEVRTVSRYRDSVALERGPLVFALRIGEEWRQLKGIQPHADWEVYPTTPWNYALAVDSDHPEGSVRVLCNDLKYQPFDPENSPVELRITGRRLPDWKLEANSAGELPQSPVVSGEPDEELVLVPYGAAKLRITEFPRLKGE